MNDMLGQPIQIGDNIVWASVTGRSSFIRTGFVRIIGDKSITVDVEHTGALGKYKNSGKATLLFPERTLIIKKGMCNCA